MVTMLRLSIDIFSLLHKADKTLLEIVNSECDNILSCYSVVDQSDFTIKKEYFQFLVDASKSRFQVIRMYLQPNYPLLKK